MSEGRSLQQRSLTALFWSYSGAITRLLSQMVIQVALARILGPGAFGQATVVFTVLGIGWMLADAGFGSALIQKKELFDEDVAYALGWVLMVSVAVGLVIAAGAELAANAFDDPAVAPLLRACALLVPLQALSNIPMSLLRRQLDMKRQQIIQVCSYLVSMGGVAMLLAVWGFGAWSLIAGFGIQTAIVLVAGYAAVRHPLRPRFTGDRQLRSFGLNVMGINMANWAIDNLDRILIGRLWGTASLGEYSAMSNLSRAPASVLVGAAQSVVFASASRVQNDRQVLARGFLATASFVLLLACPVFGFLALHASEVVHLLYGERWANAAPLFAAFCVAVPAYALLAIAGPMLTAVGGARSEMKLQICVVVLVVLGFCALAGYPMKNVVWLVPFLYALRVAGVVLLLAGRIEVSRWRAFSPAIGGLGLAAMVAAGSEATRLLRFEPMADALAAAFIGALLCLVILRLVPGWLLVPELREAIRARSARSPMLGKVCVLMGMKRRAG